MNKFFLWFKHLFTDHPATVNENYFQHFFFAFWLGVQMLIGGLACIMHAIFPFIFKKTGSYFLIQLTIGYINRHPGQDDKIKKLVATLKKKHYD